MTQEALIQELVAGGYLKTPELLEAFRHVDRAHFVPYHYREEAYGNYPLPIGFGQTISQPLTVAFLLELLAPRAGEKVLEIGAGSGWQTALLAHVVGRERGGRVIALERLPELCDLARKNLQRYDVLERNIVEIRCADGTLGAEEDAPFDRIVAAAAGDMVPLAWKEQLAPGGRIVAPIRDSIAVLEKDQKGGFSKREYSGFAFVPLVEGLAE